MMASCNSREYTWFPVFTSRLSLQTVWLNLIISSLNDSRKREKEKVRESKRASERAHTISFRDSTITMVFPFIVVSDRERKDDKREQIGFMAECGGWVSKSLNASERQEPHQIEMQSQQYSLKIWNSSCAFQLYRKCASKTHFLLQIPDEALLCNLHLKLHLLSFSWNNQCAVCLSFGCAQFKQRWLFGFVARRERQTKRALLLLEW